MRRIDFSDAFPEDVAVSIPERTINPDTGEITEHSREYLFPGDITVEETVTLTDAAYALEAAEDGAARLERARALEGLLLAHFQRRTPNLGRCPIPGPSLLSFVFELYMGGEAPEDPPRAEEAPKPASKPKKNSGSARPAAKRRAKKT